MAKKPALPTDARAIAHLEDWLTWRLSRFGWDPMQRRVVVALQRDRADGDVYWSVRLEDRTRVDFVATEGEAIYLRDAIEIALDRMRREGRGETA